MGDISTHFFLLFKRKNETARLVLKKKEGKNKSDVKKAEKTRRKCEKVIRKNEKENGTSEIPIKICRKKLLQKRNRRWHADCYI